MSKILKKSKKKEVLFAKEMHNEVGRTAIYISSEKIEIYFEAKNKNYSRRDIIDISEEDAQRLSNSISEDIRLKKQNFQEGMRCI